MVQLVDNLLERVFPRIRRRPHLAYPLAIAIFVIAVCLRLALSRWLQGNFPFLTFSLAILLSSLVAGTGPAIVVAAGAILFSWYYYLPDIGWTLDITTIVPLTIFTILASFIIAIVHLLNRKVEGLMNERARSEALLQDSALGELHLEQLNVELRHRLKNTFAVIAGLVSQSARYSPDVRTFAQSLSGRLSAMGNAMDLVATRSFVGASLKELIEETLKPLVPPGDRRIEMEGPDTIIPGEVASALALTLHELGTNAIKYGAWSEEGGAVGVKWMLSKLDDDELSFQLDWDERGGPRVDAPERRGLGTTLIDNGFPSAQVEREFHETGVRCRIVAVLKQPTTRRTRGRGASTI
ncbi:HWE histidine kinase domain-containing protein [Hyphomicrobium sp.]|uniref:HWE histidine kinase domain-containing protein n=1 Tax=Hyphomicrobium sp. TaxID=82 RepID=UPI002D781C9D|nr:HWE histidine kinase domain-containing protein [Hyphomicrobium sp.]HET6389084.1 HWE histidine kinase domain-containing protein [Hyphomicrobium sp.]